MKKTYLITFLLLLSFVNNKLFGQTIFQADFNAKVDMASGLYPVGVAVNDIDGDGKPDIITANEGSTFFSVFRNISAAAAIIKSTSFAARTDISTGTGSAPESLFIYDIDGDGKQDVVLSNFNSKTLSVFRNLSTSGIITFAAKVDINVGFYAHSISFGDIDKDGHPDIAVVNPDAGTVSLFRNTSTSGTVSFAAGFDVPVGGKPSSAVIADIDGDAKPDLAVVTNDRSLVTLYLNTAGTGAFTTTTFGPRKDFMAGDGAFAIAAGDIDGDNKIDLAVTNLNGRDSVSVFRNTSATGNIAFAKPVSFATGVHPYSIRLADLEGDGKNDILVGSWFNNGSVSLLQNNSVTGALLFFKQIVLTTGSNPQSVATGDLNADTKTDIVTANSYANTISIMQYAPVTAVVPVYAESTASKSVGSFVSTDLLDNEWKQETPSGYTIAADNGTTINPSANAGANAGRFAYFYAMGTRYPLTRVQGNLTFTAKGTGTIEVRILASNNLQVQASHTFALTAAYQDFNWGFSTLYPQLECIIAVIFNGGAATQASGTFKKNFCLTLRQAGLTGNFTRFRADTSLVIGNTETNWYGWSDTTNSARKKYLQHSAYARMRFQTTAQNIAVELVRDFYDKRIVNLFALTQTQNATDWDANGNIVAGIKAINNYTKVTGGKTYTISGILTANPTLVWFNNGTPMGPPATMTNSGTAQAPVYQVVAPAYATNMGLLVQNPNENFLVYVNCMVQEGPVGTVTQLDGTIPSAFQPFGGYIPSRISGPAIFINGAFYKYYQIEGTDQAKILQILTDTLPAGNKTVEVMMPGEGTYLPADPHVRRSGTYLRAVYFPESTTTASPSSTVAAGSICYVHDSILSGFNISSNAQKNVWMMKTKYDPSYGFTGDIFSEGYAGRILHTDTKDTASLSAFAQKLAKFKVDKYWFQVGVNDYGFLTPLHLFYSEYKALIEKLKVLRPNAKMYIQSVGPDFFEGANTESYDNDGLTPTGPTANDYRDVQRALATSHSYCEYVDFEGLYPSTVDFMADGVHPTDTANTRYAMGIKNKSTLLGTVLPVTSLAFYRSSIRSFIQTVPSVSIITATGGKPPYVFTLASGTLPTGLTLNPDGTITGTAASSFANLIGVTVKDANNTTVTQSFGLTVTPAPVIKVIPFLVQSAVKNVPYYKAFRGLFGYGKYKFTVSAGSLPLHMTLDTLGVLSGTPLVTDTGTYHFTIRATDHFGFAGTTAYTFKVGSTTPPALTDHYYCTATINSNALVVTGHMHDLYDDNIYTYVDGWVTQNGVEYYVGGHNVNFSKYTLDSNATPLGVIDPNRGAVTSIRLQVPTSGGVAPSSLDGINFTWDLNQVIPWP
jgi:hypothetical protein